MYGKVQVCVLLLLVAAGGSTAEEKIASPSSLSQQQVSATYPISGHSNKPGISKAHCSMITQTNPAD